MVLVVVIYFDSVVSIEGILYEYSYLHKNYPV